MKTWKRKLFRRNVSNGYKSPPAARFALEPLEGRQMLTVTPHGGAVLPHVEVQGLYLGSDWLNNSTYYQQTGFLEGFLKTTVNSTYLDSLTSAGYGVGRGTFSPGKIDPVAINKSLYLNDSGIRGELQADIKNGVLQAPDSNRLYVVFVEDNVAVRDGSGATSQTDFLGYHGAFAGKNASGQAVDIHYAVVAYPGGSIGNAAIPGMSALDGLTEVASHELAGHHRPQRQLQDAGLV
jgi:hypothetical protein